MSLFYSIDTDEVKDDLDDPRIVIRPAEVGELLDLHPNTVYRLLQSGKLPASKVGGAWRICKSDLIRFVERNMQPYQHQSQKYIISTNNKKGDDPMDKIQLFLP